MREYAAIKPTVYVETSVVSYLTSRLSNNALKLSRQQATRHLWDEYFDCFEFIVSDLVVTEIERGDAEEVKQRIQTVVNLTTLEATPASNRLARVLIDSGALPQKSWTDAQHISIATAHGLDYLISWNFKHIVNETKREYIHRVCRTAGYSPSNLCTPITLIEEMQMKEQLDTQTDPVLEEYFRMKEEFNAQFNSMEELSAYLKKVNAREKARGRKYIPAPPPPPGFYEKIEKMEKELGIRRKQENRNVDE